MTDYFNVKSNQRLLVTGIIGDIGTVIRSWLSETFREVIYIDRQPFTKLFDNEQILHDDIMNIGNLHTIVSEVDTVLHLAAQSTDTTWDLILNDNINAMHILYTACIDSVRKPRLIFTSSAHVNGLELISSHVSAQSLVKPDCVYAVSKLFGENLCSLYSNKYDRPAIVLRLGSFGLWPTTARQYRHTWLGPKDLCQLIYLATLQTTGFHTWYGLSKVPEPWWDQKNLEIYNFKHLEVSMMTSAQNLLDNTLGQRFQGGDWANKL